MTTNAKRLLVASADPDTPGGYGTQMKEFLPRIKRAGYDVALLAMACGKAFYHVWHTDAGPIPVFPPGKPDAANSNVLGHAFYYRPEVVLTLMDPLRFDPYLYGKLFWVAWTPSDSEPVAPDNVAALHAAALVWTLSKHGEAQLRQAGFDPVYVPHGIDTQTVFKPVDRQAARQTVIETLLQERGHGTVDLDGTFLVAMNAANLSAPSRKCFWEGFAAFKMFSDRHEDARLYVHSDVTGQQGEPLMAWVDLVGLDPAKIVFAPAYPYLTGLFDPAWLNALYNAADVFLQPSHGEGFGLPILEAQADGTPVIVTDFSSMPELVFAGWKVPVKTLVPALNPGCLHAMPDIDGIDAALEEAYRERHNTTLREQARAGALAYDSAHVFETYMRPALEMAFQEAEHYRQTPPALRRRRIVVEGVPLVVRPHTWDAGIAREVQRAYAPDVIDYTQVRRVVDVGAHIGTWSAWVRHQAPEALIVAVEPDADNFALLRENLDGQAILHQAAVTYQPGDLVMVRCTGNTGGHTLSPAGQVPRREGEPGFTTAEPYTGARVTLETLLDGQGDWDVLKLDCEGGEWDILAHAQPATLQRFTWIVGEYHTDMMPPGAAIRAEGFDPVRLEPTAANLGLFVLRRMNG